MGKNSFVGCQSIKKKYINLSTIDAAILSSCRRTFVVVLIDPYQY